MQAIDLSKRSVALVVTACVWFGVLALPSVGVVGCGGSQPEEVDTEPEKTPEEIAEERRVAHLKRIKDQLKEYKKLMRDRPERYEDNLQNFRGFEVGARGTKYEEEAKEIIEDIEKKFSEFAKGELEKLFPDIDTLVKAGDFTEAEETLDKWNRERFWELPARESYEAKKLEIKKFFDAEGESRTAIKKARQFSNQEDNARAVAILEGFPKRYEDTPYYDEVRSRIDSYYQKYKSVHDEKQEQLKVAWNEMRIDEYFGELDPRATDDAVWTVSGETIEGHNTTEHPAQIVGGEDHWIDFHVELDIRIGTDQSEVKLGVHSIMGRGNMQQFGAYSFDLEGGEWHRLLIRVQEGRVYVEDPEEGARLVDGRLKYPEGGFAFLIMPDEKIAIRNIRYKVLLEGDKPGGDDSSGDDSSGDEDE